MFAAVSATASHATSNRACSLLVGGETASERVALSRRAAMRSDPEYARAVHALWSVFAKDERGMVGRAGYLEGLSKFCRVLMPNLPRSQVAELVANDWADDVGHYSSDGKTLDFDAFYEAVAELTDLWCPVTSGEEYVAFLNSLLMRATARVVHGADGRVLRRDLAESQYVFIADEENTSDPAPAAVPSDEMDSLTAATKIQALRRGKAGRKEALQKKYSKMRVELNPDQLDLRRPKTKMRSLAASKMQAVSRGRKGREKARKKREDMEAAQQNSAAIRMQAVSRGRRARERAEHKKVRSKFAALIPPGMDLRRPAKRRAEAIRRKQLQEAQEQESAAVSMQKVQRARAAKKIVAEKRRESNAAVSMQKMQRARAAKKRVAKIREEQELALGGLSVGELDLRRPSTKRRLAAKQVAQEDEMNFALQSDVGVWHEIVDYGASSVNSTPEDKVVTIEWATDGEIEQMIGQGLAARPAILQPGHTLSPFWEAPIGDTFATHSHPLIQSRNHAHLRALQAPQAPAAPASPRTSALPTPPVQTDAGDSAVGTETPASTKLRFQAIARAVGKLSSLKQFVLERHLLLYGSTAKNSSIGSGPVGLDDGDDVSLAYTDAKGNVLPEAAPVPVSRDAKNSSMDHYGARDSNTKTAALKRVGTDPCDEDELDKARALRCNDASCTTGEQRGLWVIGGPALDADLSERVCARLARDLCLNLVTPQTVLSKAVKDAAVFQKKKQEVEDANASLAAEAVKVEEGEEHPEAATEAAVSPALVPTPSLSAKIGASLLSGGSVSQDDLDALLLEALVVAAAPGGKGYALMGFPRTKEQSTALNQHPVFSSLNELRGSAGFAPKWIVKLDTGKNVDNIVLRQTGRVVDMMTGNSSTQAERTARITSAQRTYDAKIAAARNEALAAAREELGEDDEPIPDSISNEDLGIDIEALELPDVPTEDQLCGPVPVTLPVDADASHVKKSHENFVEPLSGFEHELPRSVVVHVDATQPLFEDIVAQLIPKLVGSKDVGNPFGPGTIPLLPLAFPEISEELRTVFPEPPAPEGGKLGEEEAAAEGVAGEETIDKADPEEVPAPTPTATPVVAKIQAEKLNPPLTVAQRQHLLFGEVQVAAVDATLFDDEERDAESESKLAAALGTEGVGRFLAVNAGGEMGGSLLPPPRRWSYFREYCPVSLCEKGILRTGAIEHAVMLGGKVYVMKDAESKAVFMASPQNFIAERPRLPSSRKVCFIGATYANNAMSKCAAIVAESYGLMCISASGVLSKEEANGPEGVSAETLVEKMLAACADAEGEDGTGGWVMEGCPLNANHLSLLLASGRWNPDVVSIFAPPERFANEEFAAAAAKSVATVARSMPSESSIVADLTLSFKAYADQHPLMLSALREAASAAEAAAAGTGMVVHERPDCAEDESTANTHWNASEAWGNADLIAMVGWMEQSTNPFSMQPDPESDISPLGGGGGPGEDQSAMLVQCSNAGILCPVALSMGTMARGKPELYTIINGATYTFCDAQAKAKFDSCPSEFDGEGGDVGYYLPPPMRLLVVGQRGTDRSKLVAQLAEEMDAVVVSIKDDFMFQKKMDEFDAVRKKRAALAAARAAEDGEGNDDEDAEMFVNPAPETYVFPILERLFHSDKTLASGCIVDGDPNIFTPEVVQGMIARRFHPTAVLHAKIDNSLAAERRLPEEFSWTAPAPEPPVLNEDGEIDEDADQPEQLTKEQLTEMEEEARSEVLARLTEEGETTLAACTALLEAMTEANVDVLPAVSVGVSFPLAIRRLVAASKRHCGSLASVAIRNQAVPLGPPLDEDMDEEVLSAAKQEAMGVASQLVATGYKDVSRFKTRCPVDVKSSRNSAMWGQGEELGFPVVYRHHVYFCSSQANRVKFCASPTEYLGAAASATPTVIVPPTCCIVGPPMSGKSTLARALAMETGAVLLTPATAIEWSMRPENTSSLACAGVASGQLLRGLSIQSPRDDDTNSGNTATLLLNILKARIARSDCQRYGWVLDGFPETRAEAAALVASDLAPGIVLCLEGLSNVDIMSRQRASYSHMMDSALTSSTSPSQDVHSSAVLGRLQRWKRSSESTKATLSQAYLNIQHITAGNQGSSGNKDNQRAARSKWQVLASARDALAKNVSQRSAHASAIAQHVPAPIAGVPILASELKARRGHFGGYCPVSWVDSKNLVAIPHGSVAQREFGVSFNGRIYTCANKKRLRRFIADPWRFVSPSADSCSLPQDLPLSVPLGSHLRSSVQDFAFDGYCPVTFAEGRGPRDWDSIVEGDPVSAVKYQGKTYAFANASQKHKFMRRPSAYIDLELPLKLPPKMKPMSLEQLKSGGLHGVLAVMEQSLSVATQNALLALGQARIKFPSLSVSESASKFVSLYLKSQNPNSKPEIRKRFASKLDVFINECSLAGYLKENADVLAGTPRGSGIKAVRGLSDRKEDDKKAAYLQKASQFEMLCNEGQESLEERFLNP